MTEEQIVQMVQERLKEQHPEGITIQIVLGTHREGEFWYIPVKPDMQPQHTFSYYDALAEIETELSMNHNLEVLLVPILAADGRTESIYQSAEG